MKARWGVCASSASTGIGRLVTRAFIMEWTREARSMTDNMQWFAGVDWASTPLDSSA